MHSRAPMSSRLATRLVATGHGLLAVGVLAGVALRDDPDWFVAPGLPGNLLAAVGFVVLAVTAVRRRTLSVLGGVGGFLAGLAPSRGRAAASRSSLTRRRPGARAGRPGRRRRC